MLTVYQVYMALREGFAEGNNVPNEHLRFRRDSEPFKNADAEIQRFLADPAMAMREHVFATVEDTDVLTVHVDAFLDPTPIHIGAQRIIGCAGTSSDTVKVQNPPLPSHRGNSGIAFNAYFPIFRCKYEQETGECAILFAGLERDGHVVDAIGPRDAFLNAFSAFSALTTPQAAEVQLLWDASASHRLWVLELRNEAIANTIKKLKHDHEVALVTVQCAESPTETTSVDKARTEQVTGLGQKLLCVPTYCELTPFRQIILGFTRRQGKIGAGAHYVGFNPDEVIDLTRALFRAVGVELCSRLRTTMPELPAKKAADKFTTCLLQNACIAKAECIRTQSVEAAKAPTSRIEYHFRIELKHKKEGHGLACINAAPFPDDGNFNFPAHKSANPVLFARVFDTTGAATNVSSNGGVHLTVGCTCRCRHENKCGAKPQDQLFNFTHTVRHITRDYLMTPAAHVRAFVDALEESLDKKQIAAGYSTIPTSWRYLPPPIYGGHSRHHRPSSPLPKPRTQAGSGKTLMKARRGQQATSTKQLAASRALKAAAQPQRSSSTLSWSTSAVLPKAAQPQSSCSLSWSSSAVLPKASSDEDTTATPLVSTTDDRPGAPSKAHTDSPLHRPVTSAVSLTTNGPRRVSNGLFLQSSTPGVGAQDGAPTAKKARFHIST